MADYDLAVIGGGINGAGIARDAVGRGLRVLLVEQHDFASATSSASTKLRMSAETKAALAHFVQRNAEQGVAAE